MGADYTIDLTSGIRRILNIIAILERRKGYELSSSDIKNELSKFDFVNEDDSKIIPRFKEHILEWEHDYGLRLIKGANVDADNPRSPFKFNIDKEQHLDKAVYKEPLRIAFALILIRNGEPNFLNDFLELENPLWTLTVILDSV